MDINMTSPSQIRAIMERHGIAPLKRYGQNFLTDGNIADKIAESAAPEGACVLEIGAGLGALTQRLAARAKRVVSYEIDSGLVRALRETLGGADNASVIHGDFLKADIESELPPLLEGDIYVAANLPYYITTDCIMKLITARLDIKSITVMVQKEFAQRLLEPVGAEAYGALNAAVGRLAKVRTLFDVPASCFFPKPGVGSSVIKLDMLGVSYEEAADYLSVIRALFAAKRKTVKSNLRSSYSLSLQQAESVLKESEIDENARAQTISVSGFVKICANLKKFITG